MARKVIKFYGPPGTGKTTKLMELVEAEVRAGTPLNRIGYFSFTKSAADVIRERLNASVDDMRWFRTLHGACVKAMGMGGAIINHIDYRLFTAASKMKITTGDLTQDYDPEDQANDYNITLRALQLAATTLRPVEDVLREMQQHPNLTRPRVEKFHDAWTAYKREQHKYDFMDMLIEYDRDGSPLPLDVVFLDEAQDLSNLQWRVFNKMASGAQRVYMCGDDDQAIYTFIGGSEYGFLEYPADEEFTLPKSYRVPKHIGDRADNIIRRIAHRKEKAVEWRDAPGEVAMMNLDATSMPWRTWIAQFESIMVLTRHRSGARAFSEDLRSVGVPHSLHGESIHSWKEAKLVHSYFVLKDGGEVTARAAGDLMEAFGLDAAAMRDVPRRSKLRKGAIPGVDFDTAKWSQVMGQGSRIKAKKFDQLRRLVNQEGHDALVKEPNLSITTMHGSKGREADLVIIDPACTGIVRRNLLTPTEMRLSYVSLTRAKKQAVVLVPRTDNYIHHFFGV
jgi:DNA helicase-2/ATP-dependent DNA helicase PcrA